MLLNSSYISSWSHTTTYKFLQLDMNITMLKSREKKIAMEEESFSQSTIYSTENILYWVKKYMYHKNDQ